jgi:ketosteroid isomerase-like protein
MLPGACFAQGATKSFAPGDAAKYTGSQEQIARMTEEVVAAEVREDIAALDRFFTENYTHTHAVGKVESKAEFIGAFRPGTHKYKSADISQIQVRFFGTSAIVSGHERIGVVDGDHHYLFSAFWIQEQGKWRMAAWVASPDPKNPRDPGTRN